MKRAVLLLKGKSIEGPAPRCIYGFPNLGAGPYYLDFDTT
jgi:hypothetical protein